MGTKSKPWFGKRWTKSLVGWLDTLIFSRKDGAEFVTVASSFCVNFTIGLVVGICVLPMAIFMEPKQIYPIIIGAGVALSLLSSIIYLWKTVGYFLSIWVKILRCLYVVVINAAICGVAFFVGMYGALVAVVLFILWGVFSLIWGDMSGSGNKKRIRLNNGEELTVEKGLCGEEYYTDRGGASYEKVGSDSYIRKEY